MNKLVKPFVLICAVAFSTGAFAQEGKKHKQVPLMKERAVKQIETPNLQSKKGPKEIVKSEKKITNHSIAHSKRARAIAAE